MLNLVLFSVLGQVGENFYHHYEQGTHKLDEWYSVDYVRQYSGATNTQYSTAHEAEYIIDTYYDNQTQCELECNGLDNCLGYVNYRVDAEVFNCNLLSNLGGEAYTNEDSVSYKKVVYYNHPNNIGYSGVSFTTGSQENMTVYLDINHNGVLDPGEPVNYTNDNYYFELNGVDPGMYALRTESSNDMCVQLYPSILGFSYGYMGNGIADYVKYFHSHNNTLSGGVINHSLPYNTPLSFNYILNIENNTYLSFTHGDTIILGFSNEVVREREGAELFFKTYQNNNTDIYGEVSVAYNDNNFTVIGLLTANETTFDIGLLNTSNPIKLVKVEFFSPNNLTNSSFNIVNLEAVNDVYYEPAFAYYGSYTDRFFIFITDCSFYYPCYTFCDYHITGFNQRSSCEYGCNLFEKTQNCNCSFYNDTVFYVDTTLNQTECNIGCDYQLGNYIFPNYTVVDNAEGFNRDILHEYLNLDDTLGFCNSNPDCHGITLDLLNHLSTQSSFNHIFSNHSRFLIRNALIGDHDIHYMTTTPTTSPSSTLTSTVTSSHTTSHTTSPTSSVTTSHTTSPTTSLTSTVTTSHTTSPTNLVNNNSVSGDTTTKIIIAMSVLGILMVLVGAGYMYQHRHRKITRPAYSTQSFSNPAYDVNEIETTDGGYMDVDYQDKPEMETGTYLDVSATQHASDV